MSGNPPPPLLVASSPAPGIPSDSRRRRPFRLASPALVAHRTDDPGSQPRPFAVVMRARGPRRWPRPAVPTSSHGGAAIREPEPGSGQRLFRRRLARGVLSALANRARELDVISRTTMMSYRAKPMRAQPWPATSAPPTCSRDRAREGHVRVTLQLVDAVGDRQSGRRALSHVRGCDDAAGATRPRGDRAARHPAADGQDRLSCHRRATRRPTTNGSKAPSPGRMSAAAARP